MASCESTLTVQGDVAASPRRAWNDELSRGKGHLGKHSTGTKAAHVIALMKTLSWARLHFQRLLLFSGGDGFQ